MQNQQQIEHPEPPPVPPDVYQYLQWLFTFHLLTIKQKVLTIAQKYHVYDEYEQARFYVVRPPKLLGNTIAGIAAFITYLPFLVIAFRTLTGGGNFLYALAALFLGGWISGIVRLMIVPYRDIRVYTDETEQFQVLFITQDNKIGLYHWYTIYDAVGMPVARAKRNFFLALIRRGWVAETFDGRPICRIREDSWMLALLRRRVGPLWGLLRTNFDFEFPDGTRLGEYNRKITITDQYILSLNGDPYYLVDRRVVLAMAILLDTAEGR